MQYILQVPKNLASVMMESIGNYCLIDQYFYIELMLSMTGRGGEEDKDSSYCGRHQQHCHRAVTVHGRD